MTMSRHSMPGTLPSCTLEYIQASTHPPPSIELSTGVGLDLIASRIRNREWAWGSEKERRKGERGEKREREDARCRVVLVTRLDVWVCECWNKVCRYLSLRLCPAGEEILVQGKCRRIRREGEHSPKCRVALLKSQRYNAWEEKECFVSVF